MSTSSFQLNPQQLEAVHYLGGPLFVLAGAGSGKTRVITEKIAHLIREVGYAPHNIAAITFTNKAAAEMQERTAAMLGSRQTRWLTVCTFHSLGMRLLREEAQHIGYKKNFSVFDGSDSGKIIAELLGSSGRDAVFRAQHKISLWKNDLLTPEQAFQVASNQWERQTAQLYAGYQETLHSYQAVDFDDLILLPTRLLQNEAGIRIKWQMRLLHLLGDKCQAPTPCQYTLMKLLTGAEGRFTAVGDDDQSIYAWRGANMENLRLLQQDYPALKIIKLEQNYRSSARILRVANQVIANNPKFFPKTLWSQYGEGEPVRIIACQNEQHEAEYAAGNIICRRNQSGGSLNYADFAILYRSNHQARLFEEALRSAHIPYRVSGGQSFFEKAEIKDILAYLRLLANPDDDPAFLRAATPPKRGIGDATLSSLNRYAAAASCSLYAVANTAEALAQLPAAGREALRQFTALMQSYQSRAQSEPAGSLIQELLADIRYETYLLEHEEGKSGEIKWRNVQDLCAWLARKGEQDGKTLIELSQTIALMNLLDSRSKEETDTGALSTLPASKGLAYPRVSLAGCEEGLFPHADSVEEGNLDEERRLMYVGITRAKHSLTLTHCVKRRRQGGWQFPEPSRFIGEMPQADLKILGRKGGEPIVSHEEGKANLRSMLDMLNAKMGQKK